VDRSGKDREAGTCSRNHGGTCSNLARLNLRGLVMADSGKHKGLRRGTCWWDDGPRAMCSAAPWNTEIRKARP
jgi:hypothetical protein